MKRFYESLPGTLLLSYAVYTAFVPVSIAHSIILFSLAGLFGYSLYIHSQKLPSKEKELKSLIEQLEQKLTDQKELSDERLKKLEDTTGALALSNSRVASSSAPKREFKF